MVVTEQQVGRERVLGSVGILLGSLLLLLLNLLVLCTALRDLGGLLLCNLWHCVCVFFCSYLIKKGEAVGLVEWFEKASKETVNNHEKNPVFALSRRLSSEGSSLGSLVLKKKAPEYRQPCYFCHHFWFF